MGIIHDYQKIIRFFLSAGIIITTNSFVYAAGDANSSITFNVNDIQLPSFSNLILDPQPGFSRNQKKPEHHIAFRSLQPDRWLFCSCSGKTWFLKNVSADETSNTLVNRLIRLRQEVPGSPNTPTPPDPKIAPPFSFQAHVWPFWTFAVQLRVLARILDHDEEFSIRTRYAEENLLIVPFFPNSPDFWYIKLYGLSQIV